jgi:hypothetical protein
MFRETSIKATERGIQTDRECTGFSSDDHERIKDFIGEENYNKFAEIFPRALFDPGRYTSVMFGKDGSDYEMYVENGPDIMSYDLGKSEECIYHNLDSTHFKFVYEYIQTKLDPAFFSDFVAAMNGSDCGSIYCKKTRRHMFSYLFKYEHLVPVPAVKKYLCSALSRIFPADIQMNDKQYVIYIGIAYTWDHKTEMSVYFRD